MANPITSTNHDSKGNPGKWKKNAQGKWVFSAAVTPWNEANLAGSANVVPYTPPAASQAPAPTALPPDASYDAILASLGKTRDDTIAGLTGQENQLQGQYGYQASYDPSGNVSGLQFDPSNPFSRAALLQRTYQQTKSGAKNSSAASGQFRSGSYQNALNQAYFTNQAGENALKTDLTSQLAALIGQKTAASDTYGQSSAQAFADSLAKTAAGQNALYTPTPNPEATAPALTARRVEKTVNGVQYYRTASGKLAPIPKGAPILK